MRFDRSTLPFFVVWKIQGDPRNGYVVGLEPSSNYANLRTFERAQGRVARLQPGETRTFRVSMELLLGAPGVAAAHALVEAIQGATPPRLHRQTGVPSTDPCVRQGRLVRPWSNSRTRRGDPGAAALATHAGPTDPSAMGASERVIVAGDALLHPAALASVALLVLNDHVLKAASPGLLTGKASDFAGMAFFPLVLLSVWEVSLAVLRRWRGPSVAALVAATAATAAVFVAAKATDAGNSAVGFGVGWLQWAAASAAAGVGLVPSPEMRSATLVKDPSDLVALAAIGVCLAVGMRRVSDARRAGGQP